LAGQLDVLGIVDAHVHTLAAAVRQQCTPAQHQTGDRHTMAGT